MLVRRGAVQITRADFDSALERMPPDQSPSVANSERLALALIDQLLVARELAAKARQRNLQPTEDLTGRSLVEQDRILAAAWISDVEQRAGAQFDANRELWERHAREVYESSKSRFATPEQVVVTQIYIANDKAGPADAKRRAAEASATLATGADFTEMALAISDEPSIAATRGRLGPVARNELPPPAAEAAFALAKPGDISMPIQSASGWQLFRLEERRPSGVKPFEAVKDSLLMGFRKSEIEAAHAAIYDDLRANKDMQINWDALSTLNAPVEPAKPAAAAPSTMN